MLWSTVTTTAGQSEVRRQLPNPCCSPARDESGRSHPSTLPSIEQRSLELHAARWPLGAAACQLMLQLRVGVRSAARFRSWHRSFRAASILHDPKTPDKINYNTSFTFDDAPDAKHIRYRRVTANDLEKLSAPPTEVKMLVRDFIEDSLYNPQYGYFPKQATIFTTADPVKFNALRDAVEFQEEVATRYAQFEIHEEGPGRQIWHTPTELFKVCLAPYRLLRTR